MSQPAPFNDKASPADLRDVHAVRAIVESEQRSNVLFRAEMRAFMLRSEAAGREAARDRATMLRHLSTLVEVPRDTSSLGWRERAEGWLGRPATTRALVYALAVAAFAVSASGCLAHPLAHVLMGGHP